MEAMTPGERLARWRKEHWPPKGLRQHDELPIYIGDHDAVTAFAETLAEAMIVAASHVYEECRGQVPQWMHVPKLYFGVKRLNLVRAMAKSSRRFESAAELVGRCGSFDAEGMAAVEAWLAKGGGAQVVAHKPFVDLRAYVFTDDAGEPDRVRFYDSGLVIAAAEGFTILDHRKTERRPRRDRLTQVLAANAKWTVFAKTGHGHAAPSEGSN